MWRRNRCVVATMREPIAGMVSKRARFCGFTFGRARLRGSCVLERRCEQRSKPWKYRGGE
jgi:hypothetical protein